MKTNSLFFYLFCLSLFNNNAENRTSVQKERIEEFRVLFVQNIQLQNGNLSKHKNINFSIDACSIKIETIDFENRMDEKSVIFMPTQGAVLYKNGEIRYKTKVIKEVLENKISKQIITNFYSNSKEIGLFLKFANQKKYKQTQETIKELSGFCKTKNY